MEIGRKLYDAVILGGGRTQRTYPDGRVEVVLEVVVLIDPAAKTQRTIVADPLLVAALRKPEETESIGLMPPEAEAANLIAGRKQVDLKTGAVQVTTTEE